MLTHVQTLGLCYFMICYRGQSYYAVGLHPVHSSLYNTWGNSIILRLFNNGKCNLFGLNIRLNFNRMFFFCVAILTWKTGNLLRNTPMFVSFFILLFLIEMFQTMFPFFENFFFFFYHFIGPQYHFPSC